jgi:hypothetical protein
MLHLSSRKSYLFSDIGKYLLRRGSCLRVYDSSCLPNVLLLCLLNFHTCMMFLL